MFNLIPFSRKNELTSSGDFFNSMVDQFFRDDFFAPFAAGSNSFRADLKENEDNYVIKADLPGINKDNITLTYANDYLTISAKRDEEAETKQENYLSRERRTGEFSRSFYLSNVRGESIDAEFKDGVLTISLPKKEKSLAENKTIPIR